MSCGLTVVGPWLWLENEGENVLDAFPGPAGWEEERLC